MDYSPKGNDSGHVDAVVARAIREKEMAEKLASDPKKRLSKREQNLINRKPGNSDNPGMS
jgi:hypothetical protein